jgi:transcriptional regulator with XRE-family HTH domain
MRQTRQETCRSSEAVAQAPSFDFSTAKRCLGERIRARRKALGISQERLAPISGVDRTFLAQVERGKRNPSLHSLLKLALGLQMDVGELVQGLCTPPDTRSERGA